MYLCIPFRGFAKRVPSPLGICWHTLYHGFVDIACAKGKELAQAMLGYDPRIGPIMTRQMAHAMSVVGHSGMLSVKNEGLPATRYVRFSDYFQCSPAQYDQTS